MGGRGGSSGLKADIGKVSTNGFPELKGSEKQVRWAQSIIDDAIGTINTNIDRLYKQYKSGFEPAKSELEAFQEVGRQIVPALKTYESASQLIDRRSMFSPNRILDLVNSMEMRKKNKKK